MPGDCPTFVSPYSSCETPSFSRRDSFFQHTIRPTLYRPSISLLTSWSILASIKAALSELANFSSYQEAVSNLIRTQTWDEFQGCRWMLKVTDHLTERAVLCEMETAQPNSGFPT